MGRDPFCAECDKQACVSNKIAEEAPVFCPSLAFPEVVDQARMESAEDPELNKLVLASARTEMDGYLRWTRVEEIVHFARKIGAEKIGIASCLGLLRESALAAQIFRKQGLKVVSVCCKVGAVDKEKVGLGPEERIRKGKFEAICMPIAQAEILNQQKTQLNVVIGLCVGHDSLFFKRSEAPATVLIAKDRVTGHNPVAALYGCHQYYRKLMQPF